jgi:hypothetical protein
MPLEIDQSIRSVYIISLEDTSADPDLFQEANIMWSQIRNTAVYGLGLLTLGGSLSINIGRSSADNICSAGGNRHFKVAAGNRSTCTVGHSLVKINCSVDSVNLSGDCEFILPILC